MTNSQKILLFAYLLASTVGQVIANGNARMSRSLYEAQGPTATESDHDAKKKQSGKLLLEQAIPRPDDSLGEKQLIVRGAEEGGELNGEEACENRGYTQTECFEVGDGSCCEWDDGECWSKIDQNVCPGTGTVPVPIPPPTASPVDNPTASPVDNTPKEGQWIVNNNGDATEEAISGTKILITLPFNTSNRERGADVYESDCVTELNSTIVDESAILVATTGSTSNVDDGFIQFNTTLTVDIDKFNNTKYYEPFTDGRRGGYIQLCVETFLSIEDRPDLGNDVTDQKVNFTNNVLNISVSLTSDFQVDDVEVERKEVDTENVETDYSEFINAFLCNPADQAIIYAPEPYNQGDPITICAEDIGTNIVQVEEFNNLVVSQDGNTPYNFVKNTLHNPEITTLGCVEDGSSNNRRVCYAKFVALPRFFAGAEPNDLTISGSVFVIRDGARVRRSLRMALPAPEENNAENALAVSGRRAQAEDEEGTGDFEVTASLGSATADSAAPGLTAAVAGLVSVAVGAAGEALMA